MHPIARDLEAVSLRAHHLTPALNAALDHLKRQIDMCDGWPAGTDDPKVTTSITSSVETAAARRYAATSHREDIRDAVRALHDEMRNLDGLVRNSYRLDYDRGAVAADPPSAVPLCKDAQVGKDGAAEWGDPICNMPHVKKGLCQQHYDAWRYWRRKHGIDTSRDFEPAGFHHE